MKKICSKCKVEKELSEFYKHPAYKDGLRSECKQCYKVLMRAYRTANKDAIAEQQRAYRAANKDAIREYGRAYQAANPHKKAAQSAVAYALKTGRLKKPPCCSISNCGGNPIHGHHFDYNQPLQVIWLCRKHHKRLHAKLNEKK